MIPPDGLTEEGLHWAVGSSLHFDSGGHRTPSGSVKPPIRAPLETVGNGVGVFQAKARKMHLRWAIRAVVLIAVWIKKQIGRVHDPQPLGIKSEGSAHVEPLEKGLIRFKKPVPILVLMDGDAVLSPEFLMLRQKEWRWGWHRIKDLAQMIVPGQHLKPCRIWILDVLNHPHAPLGIEVHIERLPNGWLMSHQIHGQTRGGLKLLVRERRIQWLALALSQCVDVGIALVALVNLLNATLSASQIRFHNS